MAEKHDPGAVHETRTTGQDRTMEVELPDPDIIQDTYLGWSFSIDGEREAVTCPADEIHVSGIGQFTRSDARDFALALLAAVAALDRP